MNQSNSSNSSSVKVVCVSCKGKAAYPLTLHCHHKICFKCGEKLNKKDRFEEQNSLTCPSCKVVTQITDIYKLVQDNIQNTSELKENLIVNIQNQQFGASGNDQNMEIQNAIKKKELGYYLNQDLQMNDQGQQPQMLQNELVDEDFQFQNIPEEDDGQVNEFSYQGQQQQNQGNILIDARQQQQQGNNTNFNNINQVQQLNQDYEQDEGLMQLNDLQQSDNKDIYNNQWIQQNQYLQNQYQQQEEYPYQQNHNEIIDEANQHQGLPYQNYEQFSAQEIINEGHVPQIKQQPLYYEDDSLSNLQDNLRKGISGGVSGGEKNIKKKSIHNQPSNESIQNQNSTSTIQIRVGSGNSQGGMIINPHYYPQHARNNPNRFKSNSDKNNFLKREQELANTQQSSSDFQIFQSHPNQFNNNNNNNNNRFPSNPSKIQQHEYVENIPINSNAQDKYSPKVNQKLEFSPSSGNQYLDQYQNQQQIHEGIQYNDRLMLQGEDQILMIDQLGPKQLVDMQNAQYQPMSQNQHYNQGITFQNKNQLGDREEYEEQKANQLSSYRGQYQDQINNSQQNREGDQMNFYSSNNDASPQQQQQQVQVGPQVIVSVGGGNINPDKPLVCKEHNDYVQLYCQDDKSLLCVNCLYQNDKHKRHRVAPLKRSIDLIKKENSQFKLEAKEKLMLIENSLKICNSNKNILRDGYSFLCESVSREFAEIQRVLVEQERKVQAQIQSIFEERLKEYDQMLNDLSYLKSCIKEYKDCDKNTNPNLTVYVFSIYSMIRNTLRNIDFSFKQITKNDVNICDFKNNRGTIISEIQSFGKIINDLNIRDPNSTIGTPLQQHIGSHASSSQKQNVGNSHSNSKSNLDSNKKGNIHNNQYIQQYGSSLTNSASKSHIHQGVPVQQFLAGATPTVQTQNNQNFLQVNQTPGQKQLPVNQKSSTTSLEVNSHQMQPTKSQQNLHPDHASLQGNHSIHYSPFGDQYQTNQQNRNPKSRNQTPSPYKHNQKIGSQQMIGKELNNNIQYHRDFLDAQFEHSKKQTPRQISHHNSIQNQQQQQQQQFQQQNIHQQQQTQIQQQQLQQQLSQQSNNPHSSSYAKLIVSRSTKFSNKKQQQECFKEIQKCQTPPQDRRMNDLVKNMQNISYYALLEEKYNKRSKSSQKKPNFTQNQGMLNK